jgi:hypothetical protein
VVARSVTAGAPASLELTKVRLRPIHLEAVAKTTGLDLGLARLYFPPDAAVVLEQGRASSTFEMVLDAREGIRATATGSSQTSYWSGPASASRLRSCPRRHCRSRSWCTGRTRCRSGAWSSRDPRAFAIPRRDAADAIKYRRSERASPTSPGRSPRRPPRHREQCARRRDGAAHGRASTAARIEPVEARGQERGPRPVGEPRAGQGANHGHRRGGSTRRRAAGSGRAESRAGLRRAEPDRRRRRPA